MSYIKQFQRIKIYKCTIKVMPNIRDKKRETNNVKYKGLYHV